MEEARNSPAGGARKVLCGSAIASTLCCWTDHGDESATGGNPSGLCCQGHSSPWDSPTAGPLRLTVSAPGELISLPRRLHCTGQSMVFRLFVPVVGEVRWLKCRHLGDGLHVFRKGRENSWFGLP